MQNEVTISVVIIIILIIVSTIMLVGFGMLLGCALENLVKHVKDYMKRRNRK